MSDKADGIDKPELVTDFPEDNNAAEALEKAKADLLYQRAEFDNYKKRILREQEQAVKFANERLIGELLTVIDLFDRAVQSSHSLKAKGEPEVANFVTGVEMTKKELDNLMGRFGVEFVGTSGEKFDPSRHEAISQLPCEPAQNDTILTVVQRGCSLNGRLLKPAKVVVGKTADA